MGGVNAAATSLLPSIDTLKDIATILTPITSLIAADAAYNQDTQMPDLTPLSATPMPSLGGPNTILAQRASVAEQLARRGRASTILTSPRSESLGPGPR